MRVLMLTTNSSLLDGINRHILNVATQLKGAGVEVAVCTVNSRGELHEELEKMDVSTYSLDAPNGHKLRIIKKYSKVINDFKPDVVHIHVMALMERIVSALFFRNIKYVLTIHGISDKIEKISTKMLIERFLDHIFKVPIKAYIYISQGVKQKLNKDVSGVVNQVIYNPISFDAKIEKNKKLHNIINVDADIPIIGTSCRIASVKQPEVFTDVMCKALLLNEKVHAVVIGDGDSELIERCKQIVRRYTMEDRFHWLGFRKDAPQLVGDLSCFIMTSKSEGMPTSVLECMVSKTPFVIMRGDGGLKDLEMLNTNEKPFTVFVETDDKEGMAEAVNKIIDDAVLAERLSIQAYNIGNRHFSVRSVCNQLIALYNNILG